MTFFDHRGRLLASSTAKKVIVMNPFFIFARVVEMLLALPLYVTFQGCHSFADFVNVFTALPEIEVIGVIAISFIVIGAAMDAFKEIVKSFRKK
jgi:hypothetical protein